VGKQVLNEINEALQRKAPALNSRLAILLDRCRTEISPEPTEAILVSCQGIVPHQGDARVLAEAIASACEFLDTLDRAHFLENSSIAYLPFKTGTPGDCLSWLRSNWRTDPA
jgi:hypothetical protein